MKHPPSAMDTNTPPPVSEDELHALIDGQLTAPERQALEARLTQDAPGMATLRAWRAQREALRALHGELLREPVPASLLAAAQQAARARQQVDQWWRWGGVAASVVMAFGVGWFSHGQWQAQPGQRLAQHSREFVHQAALAHAVYSPEVRHPVEVGAAQQEHLVQWLSKRLGKPLKVPNLSAQGFELVGGRLLPGDEGARAQFMFQNAGGERITLYLGAVQANAAGAQPQETAFRYAPEGAVPGFYWIDHGFGYALSGAMPRERLLHLAQAVYQQL